MLAALLRVAVLSQSSGVAAIFGHEAGSRGLHNCALYMLLYKQQCRRFCYCSKRVVNTRSVFQERHLVIIILSSQASAKRQQPR